MPSTVPDENHRVPLHTYTNARPAIWPEADFIVGNPPFIGAARMRQELGDGYAETLRGTYPEVPESANFVMYWWYKAAELLRAGKIRRFGLITTNAITQTFNRRVVQAELSAKPAFSLVFAIPDHPWVDTADGAAVRIAMTVGASSALLGDLYEVTDEQPQEDGAAKVTFKTQRGKISADLSLGAAVIRTSQLKANAALAYRGICLVGEGFVVTPDERKNFISDESYSQSVIKPFLGGQDIVKKPRGLFLIDLDGLSESDVKNKVPAIYQRVLTTVRPLRMQQNDRQRREKWWLFGRNNEEMRAVLTGLSRFIVTCMTAKHRVFSFIDGQTVPDQGLIAIGLDDAFYLGILSSRVHVTFTLASGGTLEDRPRYNNTECFDPFPFPLCGEAEREQIRNLAEEIDAHRKRAQLQHGLTLTGIYNVLEKLRANEPLTDKEKLIHDKGLVSVLKQLHDDLDAAVFAAYGWPANLSDAEILERLVTLNAERAAEEAHGIIHWLRPDYQAKGKTLPAELPLTLDKKKPKAKAAPAKRKTKLAWPKALAERVRAVETALHQAGAPVTPATLAEQFARAKSADVLEILKTLETLGRAHGNGNGEFRP